MCWGKMSQKRWERNNFTIKTMCWGICLKKRWVRNNLTIKPVLGKKMSQKRRERNNLTIKLCLGKMSQKRQEKNNFTIKPMYLGIWRTMEFLGTKCMWGMNMWIINIQDYEMKLFQVQIHVFTSVWVKCFLSM